MMDRQNEMQAEMKSSDAELDKLLAAMNKATGKRKVEAMAAVINIMADQRKEMQRRMMEMQSQMMSFLSGNKIRLEADAGFCSNPNVPVETYVAKNI
jgi:hypothetical protein